MAKTAPKKKGRKPILDAVAVAQALTELQGNIMATAKRFGVARQSVQDLITRTPSLQAVIRDARQGMTDHAESSLNRAVIKGEAWAVCFYLKTQAKDRGYVERVEQDNTHRGEMNLNHGINDPNKALAPYADLVAKFLAGNGPPAPPPEVPQEPVGEAEAPPEAGAVPPP
jgi:hypothetical protein